MTTRLAPARTRDQPQRATHSPLSFGRALIVLAVYAVIVPGGELLLGSDAESVKASAAMGAIFYLLRRMSGVLVIPMLAHSLVDVLGIVSAPPA